MMPLNRMPRSVLISVVLLGVIDLYAAEQPEFVEQKPQYTRTRELPALKISFTDVQFALEKAANLLSNANRDGGKKPKDIFLSESLRVGTGPDEIEVTGHSFPANAHVPKAAYALSYSYSWRDAPVSRLQLDLGDWTRRLSVSGTAVDQVEAISAALERDLSQHTAIGGDMVRTVGGALLFIVLVISADHFALSDENGVFSECPFCLSSDWCFCSRCHSKIFSLVSQYTREKRLGSCALNPRWRS